MVLLQLINHLINRYISSKWLSAEREFASTENFFQVSPPLELEAQTGSKIFSEDYFTGGTFVGHWHNFFCRKSSETLGFSLFSHISKLLWTEWVAYLFLSANFALISEKRLWPLEYPFKILAGKFKIILWS